MADVVNAVPTASPKAQAADGPAGRPAHQGSGSNVSFRISWLRHGAIEHLRDEAK
jgi:hypothetical protein